MPLLAGRIGWFAAPCEVLYGALVANGVPGANQTDSFIPTLSTFGFLLLLFLAGLEIDLSLLRRRGARMLIRAGIAAIGLQVVAALVGAWFHFPLAYTLLLGMVSVSLLLVILKQDEASHSEFGQTLLVVAALGECLSILEITAYNLVYSYGLQWQLAVAALKLIGLLALAYAALRGLMWFARRNPRAVRRLLADVDPSEVGVRAALALMLSFAALALLLHVEQALAAFIAGAMWNVAFRGRSMVTEKLMTIGQGFFIPIFFITVGLSLRLSELLRLDAIALAVGLAGCTILARVLTLPLLRLAGFTWRQTLPAALLLAAPLTLQVAVVRIGIDVGQVDARSQGIALAATIIGAVVAPILARPALLSVRRQPRQSVSAASARIAEAPNLDGDVESGLDGEAALAVARSR